MMVVYVDDISTSREFDKSLDLGANFLKRLIEVLVISHIWNLFGFYATRAKNRHAAECADDLATFEKIKNARLQARKNSLTARIIIGGGRPANSQ